MLERPSKLRNSERVGTYAIPPGWRPVLLTVLASTAGEAEVSNVHPNETSGRPDGSPRRTTYCWRCERRVLE